MDTAPTTPPLLLDGGANPASGSETVAAGSVGADDPKNTRPAASDAPPKFKSATVQILEFSLNQMLYPIAGFRADSSVSEILINGHEHIYVERGGILEPTDAKFNSVEDLQAAVRSIAQFSGKRLTPDELSIEARLPDGSRVHIVQPPAARSGLTVSIRKFLQQHRQLSDIVKLGSMTQEAADLIKDAVKAHRSIIISGGTGTGKTTLLNAFSEFFYDHERILVIEDTSELSIQKDHVVYLEVTKPDRFGRGGISIRDLFRASLRMRPDRIIVGECRGGEAIDMIQAMTSGHSGGLSTLHANSSHDAMHRLETMALMSDIDMPLRPLRAQIASAVDLVVQVARSTVDGRRRVVEISEVNGLTDNDKYLLSPLYRLE